MSKGDWVERLTFLAFAAAIGALLAVAIMKETGLSTQQASQPDNTNRYTERAEQRIGFECAHLDGPDARKCANEIIDAAEQANADQEDLKAQKDMAEWAFWMMLASVASVGITAIGVFYVRATLNQTVEANKAAQAAVATTREIGEAQVRAYLTIGDITAIPWEIRKEGCLFKVRMSILNSGQSPARNVSAHIEEDERVGTIVGDIASGQFEITEVFPHIGIEDLTFFRNSETDVQLRIKVFIGFDDVFSKDGHRRRESFDFVGRGPLVKDAKIPLSVINRQRGDPYTNER